MHRLLATACVVLIAALVVAADPVGPPPIAGKSVTLAKASATPADIAAAIKAQTGLPLDVSKLDPAKKLATAFDKTPFWSAAEKLATDAGGRVVVSDGGKAVSVEPLPAGVSAPPSSVDGPFRLVVKQVVSKLDFETGKAVYTLHLEAQWESRFPVYLIDGEPKVSTATAGGKPVTADPATGRVAASGYSHPLTITLRDVPRAAKQLDEVSGTFTAVAAHRLLPFAFDDLTADKPITKEQEGVTATLKPIRHAAGRVEFHFALKYPDGHPELESFEEGWAAANRLRVTGPDGRAAFEPTDYNTDARGPSVTASYAFAGATGQPAPLPKDLTKWKAVYETPSPLLKQTVRFTLKGIPLP